MIINPIEALLIWILAFVTYISLVTVVAQIVVIFLNSPKTDYCPTCSGKRKDKKFF